jgi:hypothetical protein
MRYVPPFGTTDPDASYRNGDSRLGLQGSIPPAEAFESPMREIVALIEHANLTPTSNDLEQLTKGVRRQALNFAVDTGSVNNLSVAYDPPFVSLTSGLPLRILVAHTNTGAASLVVNNLVAAAIHRADGAALSAGDLVAGEVSTLIYDGQFFQIANYFGGPASEVTNNYYEIGIPYCADSSGVANTITAIFSPAITSLAAGDPIMVKIANANTGATTITVNALASKNVRTGDNSVLVANQVVTGMIALLVYDGTVFQLLNPIRAKTAGSSSGGVQIVNRAVYQDPQYHISTLYNTYVEAFRYTYDPVNAGDDVYVQFIGSFNAEEVNTSPIGRAINGYVAYSTDGGTTWNPSAWPGRDYPTVGTFMANTAMAEFIEGTQHINPGINRVDFNFMIAGQMTVPAGPPASIIFKLMFCSAYVDSPTTMVHGGTIVEVTEYTPVS